MLRRAAGDNAAVADSVGRVVGISEVKAALKPQDKQATVEALRTAGAGGG